MERPINNLTKCICKDCLEIARWQPTIMVRTSENDNTFRLETSMSLCDKHKKEFTINDVIPDSIMPQVETLFTGKFIYPPKKENMILEWKPITIAIVDSFGKLIGEAEVKNGAIVR